MLLWNITETSNFLTYQKIYQWNNVMKSKLKKEDHSFPAAILLYSWAYSIPVEIQL